MMTWKLAVLGLGTVVIISTLACAGPNELPDLTDEEGSYVAAYIMRMQERGHFILVASVTDEGGRAIPEFTVLYPWPYDEKGKPKPDPALVDMSNKLLLAQVELSHNNKWSRYKDGRFHLDVKYGTVSLFSIRFLAEGYYSSKVDLRNPQTDKEQLDDLLAIINAVKSRGAIPLPKEILIKKKFTVVMRKKPKATTKLQRWFVDLKLTNKGKQSFEQWAPPAIQDTYGPRKRLPAKEEKLPAGSIFLSAERKKDSGFRVLELSPPGVDPWNRVVVPVGVKIGIKGAAGDGFIRYQPKLRESTDKSIHYVPEPVRRGMGLAPEKGYQPEVSLSTEDLKGDAGPIFYFRLKGRYGRAQCRGVSFNEADQGRSRDLSGITAQLDVEWQPDGSRNLETGE